MLEMEKHIEPRTSSIFSSLKKKYPNHPKSPSSNVDIMSTIFMFNKEFNYSIFILQSDIS